jgi:hypothetical protein
MKVYKGTDMNMRCKGKQYTLGETAVEKNADLCKAGLHACEMPIDVLRYYAPNESRYFEAEAEDVSDQRENDSKIVAKKMTLKAEIGIAWIVKAQVEFTKSRCTEEPEGRATGNRGAASATGYQGAASATGDCSAASATGYRGAASATGDYGVALAAGIGCKAKGAIGCAICCVERGEWNGKTHPIVAVKAAIVDGEKIRADTWYQLKNGEFVEVE